jgi:aerobic-type carbon monoxide dehydrogenase small subunit (CoxS/CutS family)
MAIHLIVNGKDHQIDAPPDQTLLSVIRDNLELTGTKYGCGEGECGACTMLVNGEAVRSCRVRASAVAGKKIITIEGLAAAGKLHPVQEAFIKHEAFQCGYCTSGMIMAAVAFLQRTPHPTDAQIVEGMNRSMCRCGTYPRIAEAIRDAAAQRSKA